MTKHNQQKNKFALILEPGLLRKFVLKGFLLTVVLASFQMVSIVYCQNSIFPFFEHFIRLAWLASPYVSACFLVFFVWLLIKIWPILKFLQDVMNEKLIEDERIRVIQDRCLKLPYQVAIISPIFYITGGIIAGTTICDQLGAPSQLVIYGGLAGGLSSCLVTPIIIHGFHWMTEPVVEKGSALAKTLKPSRTTGFSFLTVRFKMIVTVLSIVVATTGYIAIIGYAHSDALLKMEEVESSLSSQTKAELKDKGIELPSQFKKRVKSLKAVYITLLLIAFFEALIVSILASREISNPIKLLEKAAKRIRKGVYDQPISLVSDDEISDLASTLNSMMDRIRVNVNEMEEVVEHLKNGVLQIDETSNSLREVSSDQATGATQQATAIQEASSIAEEIVATAKQIAERASLVSDVASSTLGSVSSGEQKLDDARGAFTGIQDQVGLISKSMKKLEDRFNEAFKIVALMKEIAAQTELLALNATLEAAGAGEYGRRFSVVADSTRQLALKSESAADEIMELFKVIQFATQESTTLASGGKEKVDIGGHAIGEVVEALGTISSFAGSTSVAVQEITMSTEQQTMASEQLAASVIEIHEVAIKAENSAKEIEMEIANLTDFAEALRGTVEEKGNCNKPV
jgi:methyl-accepting chemotaxis protein